MNENGSERKGVVRQVVVLSEMLEGGRVNTVVHSENPSLGDIFSILMEGAVVIIRKYCEITGADPYSMREHAYEYITMAIEDFIGQKGGGDVPV